MIHHPLRYCRRRPSVRGSQQSVSVSVPVAGPQQNRTIVCSTYRYGLGISSAARGGNLPLTISTFEAATALELTVYRTPPPPSRPAAAAAET